MTDRFNLRLERVNRGVTINRLAAITGVNRHTIMRLERGATPNAATAKAIADWAGKKPTELWPELAEAA